jgi:lipopolysaccharide/colanic/teichoic acid biosynthesis glycosyltransferase
VKRLFDLTASFLALAVLFPAFVLISIWIRLDSPGPAIYSQSRVGREGRLFRMLKFRTMYVGSELSGRLTVGDDQRITRAGKILRRHKLDELPQLVNVFCGDMSLVGPRPEVPEFVDLYPLDIRERVLSIRPGITDPASIEYRKESHILGIATDPRHTYISEVMPSKLKIYDRYISERTFISDLALILRTIQSIFS